MNRINFENLQERERKRNVKVKLNVKKIIDFFEEVSDELLISILILADYETVCRCRAVCKRWYYALTDSNVGAALALHRRHPTTHHRAKVTFLIQIERPGADHPLLFGSHFLELKHDGAAAATLTQMPSSFLNFVSGPEVSLKVRASSNEVFLLSSSNRFHYYLFNTITKQSVLLPEPPLAEETPTAYGVMSEGKAIRVVLFHRPYLPGSAREYQTTAWVFAWETGSWTKRVSPAWQVTGSLDHYYLETEQVRECMGALYWHYEIERWNPSMVRFDPYAENGWEWCTDLPSGKSCDNYCKTTIGKCRGGQLLYGGLVSDDRHPLSLCLDVWRLDEDGDGEEDKDEEDDEDTQMRVSECSNWRLQHSNHFIEMDDYVGIPIIMHIGFHPSDPDVVFLYDHRRVFQYTISSETVHPIADMPVPINCAIQLLSTFTLARWPTFPN